MGTKPFPTKTDLQAQTQKMIGTYVDENDAHRLAMISLTKGVSRSAILSQLLDTFFDDQPTLSTLITEAAKKVLDHWQDATKDSAGNFDKYLQDTQSDLIRHRIPKSIIKQIIKKVRNGRNSK